MSRADDRLPEQVLYHAHLEADRVTLDGAEAAHAVKSLRLRVRDAVVLTDGRGTWARGHVVDSDRKHLEVAVDSRESRERWPREQVWLGVGILKSHRMDVLVEKASELGVSRFFPLVLNRSVARPHEGGAKEDRWQRIALESLKQCRRSHRMEIDPVGTLDSFLKALPGSAAVWVADPSGNPPGKTPAPGSPMALVVGPEGGLDPSEVERLKKVGAELICLGHHRLRAETAGLTLLVAALERLDAFAGGYGTSSSESLTAK